jgi:hypothetical protein
MGAKKTDADISRSGVFVFAISCRMMSRMCWSGEASAVLATVGIASTAYAAYKKEPPEIYLPLAYFSLMELLQAYTYSVIDSCGVTGNQVATLLGYLHITFQPFFINMMGMYFIPTEVRRKIQPWVYSICFAFAILMLVRLYPFPGVPMCKLGTMLCGTPLCSVSGNWHIAWNIPYNDLFGNIPLYALVGLVLPVIYGSWRASIYSFTAGPVLAYLLTNNVNEQPAVWCLLSIGLLLIVVKTRVRDILHVKKWFLWPRAWYRESQ